MRDRHFSTTLRQPGKLLVRTLLIASLFSSGIAILPKAMDGIRLLYHGTNPVAWMKHQVGLVQPGQYAVEMSNALENDDIALATSVYELSLEHGISIPQKLKARLDDANSWSETAKRKARCIGSSFVTDQVQCLEGLLASSIADLSPIGDAKELLNQPWPDYDIVSVGIAAASLTASGASFAAGSGLPAKIGITTLKILKKSGKISVALLADLRRVLSRAIDKHQVKRLSDQARQLDPMNPSDWRLDELISTARLIIRQDAVNELSATGRNLREISNMAGFRGTIETVERSNTLKDLQRYQEVAAAYEGRYRGALVLTKGRRVFRIIDQFWNLLAWMAAALIWLATAAWFISRMGWRILRAMRREPRL
ncbi:hypothetical protein [Pseudomonas sp.]|uniref:hypothetical protein n=1 Tax=Pseudomonas sp. TaxID=306 RepID=UPI003A968E51